MSSEEKSTEATLKIPFDSVKHAEVAYRVLRVDQEPRRNFVQKELTLNGNVLEVHLVADQVKNLRTAITSFFENFLLCSETIKSFDAGALSSANTA
ncbi:threonyl-carbamoyl synthesis 6 [Haematobia irritans]